MLEYIRVLFIKKSFSFFCVKVGARFLDSPSGSDFRWTQDLSVVSRDPNSPLNHWGHFSGYPAEPNGADQIEECVADAAYAKYSVVASDLKQLFDDSCSYYFRIVCQLEIE